MTPTGALPGAPPLRGAVPTGALATAFVTPGDPRFAVDLVRSLIPYLYVAERLVEPGRYDASGSFCRLGPRT